ncbi:MAG: type II toxin-antitoxin system HicB family antitoxin [Magnetococcales bacterium]|nr:type II toxin-antitoxin system HicB family antitoxin [Magnetococcales bacterium]NGZ06876.1 type II toxin-antitoxin system HicB family antitoxin [Magnetococcales bacterium]
MFYPVYVHPGDKDHAHGVTIPDFPGCFSAADDWKEIPAMVQEAVEVHFHGESMEIPPPRPLEELTCLEEFQGGGWMMIDIDLSRVRPKALRLNISLPEPLVRRIDDYARTRHMSRSGFLAHAAESALRLE